MDGALGFVGSSHSGVITPEDLARIWGLFDSHLIPLAIATGVIDSGVSFADLVARYRLSDPDFGTFAHSSAKEIAADNLVTAAAWIHFAVRMSEGTYYADSIGVEDRLEWVELAHPAASMTAHTFGYLRALMDSRMDSGRRATNGRRLLGATTRERVRKAAMRHLGTGRSKEEVAALIATSVGKSFGHVLKTLIKEFPGDKWNRPPGPDASVDMAGRDGG